MHKVLVAATLAAMSFNANAVVVNTLDGVDYKWLELTATQGMSRDQVELELLDENSTLYGYEYASRAQVESLFLSYASWDGQTGVHGEASVVAGSVAFIDDFGVTESYESSRGGGLADTVDGYRKSFLGNTASRGILGLESECEVAGYSCSGTVMVWTDSNGVATMSSQSAYEGWDSTGSTNLFGTGSTSDDRYGSFLVATVPVPAAIWLFGSALAGLGWFRRKQTA